MAIVLAATAYAEPNVPSFTTLPRVALLTQFMHVFDAMEAALAVVRKKESGQGRCRCFPAPLSSALDRLRRGPAFRRDLAFFKQEPEGAAEPCAPPAPPTAAAVAELQSLVGARVTGADCCDDEGLRHQRLVLHAFTMYSALLAGGQAIRRLQRAAMGLDDKGSDGGGGGSQIFDFGWSPGEAAETKAVLRRWLDELPGSENPTVREALAQEKRGIFRRNDAIIAWVVDGAPASAYLSAWRPLRALLLGQRSLALALLLVLLLLIALALSRLPGSLHLRLLES